MANDATFVERERHDDRACNARGHFYLRTLQLGLVDEKFLRNVRRDLNLVELVGAGVRGRLRG